MITISWIKKNGNLDSSIRVDEGLRSDLPSQTRLRKEREIEYLGAGWVDEGGRG